MGNSNSIVQKVLAWSVHIFTATGLLAGFLAILEINAKNWRSAMAWLLAALVIDGIDGTFARKFNVKKVLPHVTGRTIDQVIDFATYAIIPAYFLYSAGLVHPSWNLPLTFLILLVSAVYYGIDGMVSDDFYFIGFPVMWNVVVFYLVFVFETAEIVNAAIIIIFAFLHFVPVKFAYPSRASRMKWATIAATVLMLILMPLTVWLYPEVPVWLKLATVLNLSYFGVLAVFDTFYGEQ